MRRLDALTGKLGRSRWASSSRGLHPRETLLGTTSPLQEPDR